jgi:hypothetical protein
MTKLRLQSWKFGGLVLSVVASVTAATSSPSVSNETVKLGRVEVRANRPDFEFDVQYDGASTKVQGVLVTWVSSATHKRGLRIGDRMTTIDGRRIDDLSLQELLAATKRVLGPDESQTLVFTGTRALIRRVTVTYTTKGPNKTPEPTPGTVTPRTTSR